MSNVSKRLEGQADLLFKNVAGWETNALRRIGRRVKSIKSLSYADLQALNNATIAKQDIDAILKELATLTEQTLPEVKRIYSEMIEQQHEENRLLYDYRNKPFVPFADNKSLQAIVRAYARTTADTMIKLSMTKAKQLGFVNKNGDFIPIEKNFIQVIDKAVMSIATGTGDFGSEMRDVLKELGGSGLRIDYGGGVTRRLDTMVRQNLLWGAKQASVEYNEMIGEELGCDGIEIDWHSFPRPQHEFMQGKQYSLNGKKTINSITYESAEKALAALNEYGCLHFKTPIILGVSEPRYSPEELARLNEQNKRTFEVNGKQLTGYECKQGMRRLETEVRKTKDQINILKASGDNTGAQQLQHKVSTLEGNYQRIAQLTGVKEQPEKMTVIKSKYVDNTAKSGIIKETEGGMYRKKKAEGYIEPMPKKQFLRIEKAFKRRGGLIQRSEATDNYLTSRGVEGITLNANTILLMQKPGRASVFEELIHSQQYKTGECDGSYFSRLKCEIAAQEKLLKYAKSYQLTEPEIIQTEEALKNYRKDLATYLKTMEV